MDMSLSPSKMLVIIMPLEKIEPKLKTSPGKKKYFM